MAINRKINPVGIDVSIDEIQLLLYNELLLKGWTNYESYHRVYKNESEKGVIPEVYKSDGNYEEVYFNDNFNATSFFITDDEYSQKKDASYTSNVKVIFQVKLNKLYPNITHRADEEMHRDVARIIEQSFQVVGKDTVITTGMKKIYKDEGLISTTAYEDMSYYHVVKFDFTIRFEYEC